jgi:hypothetical protein
MDKEHIEYQFFICYTRDSAEDLATHLWEGLEKRRFTAFLDLKNIPKKFRNTDEWRKIRDEALRNSEIVILIITHGFGNTDEVKNEISLAFAEEKELMLLRHKNLDKDIIVDLEDKQINLGKYNQISFDNKHDLLRNVLSTIEEEKTKLPHGPSIIKRKIQNSKAETMPSGEQKPKGSLLLPNPSNITKLSISNDLLDQIYEEAQCLAKERHNDAQLSHFTIQVYPFGTPCATVNIYIDFYSKWADKKLGFKYSDDTQKIVHLLPDKFVTSDLDREVFNTLPWRNSPMWMQFLNIVYAKIGPLPSAETTYYHLMAYPRFGWRVNFTDNFSGREHPYWWNGKEIDDKSIKSCL